VYTVIDALAAEGVATIAEVCRFLGVNRTSFHAWRVADSTVSQEQEEQLTPLIRMLFKKHRRRYGARRIASELREREHVCSPKKVSKVLKTQGLRAIQPKSFVPKTTDSRHRLGYSPNLLLDSKEPTGINQVWVGDITYIPLDGGTFCYLASLMDLFSRRIVGWHLKDDMTESLVLAGLQLAIKERQPSEGLIHHTDRGGQYAGNDYRAVLRRAGIRQSMSRADNCYDNSFKESFFGTFKTELELTEYKDIQEAIREAVAYIRYYNLERKHSALEYLTPARFEQLIHHPK
jgi:putative transposase|tara:strand:- start:6429 stop:7298 length:870 start_codon:yes stop_codon:yes gene_type:complete